MPTSLYHKFSVVSRTCALCMVKIRVLDLTAFGVILLLYSSQHATCQTDAVYSPTGAPGPGCSPLTSSGGPDPSAGLAGACLPPLAASLEAALQLATTVGQAAYRTWYSTPPAMAFNNAPPAPPIQPPNPNEASAESGITVLGKTISNGYQLPLNKQGVNDQRFMSAQRWSSSQVSQRLARYAALMTHVQPGVRRYNVFWHQVEGSSAAPSASPSLACPSGYIKVPSNETQRMALGFNKYHCYLFPILDDLDSYLALDAAHGIESAAIMWGSTPPSNFI